VLFRSRGAAPDLSAADVDAAWSFIHWFFERWFLGRYSPRRQEVRLKQFMLPDLSGVVQDSLRGDERANNFSVIVGSLRVNPAFDSVYEILRECFGYHPLEFCWPPPADKVEESLMAAALKKRYAATHPDELAWGVRCARTKPVRFFHRQLRKDSQTPTYNDVAVIAATMDHLMVFGHGPGGTLGAAQWLVSEDAGTWEKIEVYLSGHRAVVMVAQVIAECDEIGRLTGARVVGPPAILLAPKKKD
jgi:hypothetical protein